MKIPLSLVLTAFVLISPFAVSAAPLDKAPQLTPEQKAARMGWWREAKFGMFIHWGLYAIPADGEWKPILTKNEVDEVAVWTFPAVTASKVRLTFKDLQGSFRMGGFELYRAD